MTLWRNVLPTILLQGQNAVHTCCEEIDTKFLSVLISPQQESIKKDKRKESNSAWEVAKIGSVQAACLRPG